VGILSTGDEVQPAGQPLQRGQIWSSNTAALIGMVASAGGEAVDCGIAPDTLEGTRAAFQRGLDAGCDLLLSTGGVSVGDFDLVKEAMGALGAEMLFWKVRIKPGKPLALGSIAGVPAFGLPGNPVSCLVNFLQFVRPVIRGALGDPRPYLPVLRARLTASYHKRHRRAEFVRVRVAIEAGALTATPTGNQSSSWISSMADADGLMLVGAECSGFDAGALVWVQPVRGGGFFSASEPAYPW
jgi:molybdopterin molybdotransferase